MNARVIEHDHDLPLNVTQEMPQELDDGRTANGAGLRVLKKAPVRRNGPNCGELLPVRRERDQGRRRTPFSEKPTSSKYTRVAP